MVRTPLRLTLAGLEDRAVPSAVAPPAPTVPAQQAPAALPPTTSGTTGSTPATPITGTTTAPGTDAPASPATPAPGTAAPASSDKPTPPAGTTSAPAPGTVTAPPADPGGPMVPIITAAHPTHALTGRGTGTFQLTRANPDTGAVVKVQGTAQMAGLGGSVAVAGDLHVPGNVAGPVTTGTLFFSTKAGSVTVALTSFRPPAGFAAPVWYRYQVTAETGTFAGLHDTGSLRLDWVPALVTPASTGTTSGATPKATGATGKATAGGVTQTAGATMASGAPAGGSTAPGTATGTGVTIVQRGTIRLTV